MVPTLTRISNVVMVIIVSTSDAQFGFGFRGGLFPGAGRQRSSRFAAYGGYPGASNFLKKVYISPIFQELFYFRSREWEMLCKCGKTFIKQNPLAQP